jgi:hypothetical protein
VPPFRVTSSEARADLRGQYALLTLSMEP